MGFEYIVNQMSKKKEPKESRTQVKFTAEIPRQTEQYLSRDGFFEKHIIDTRDGPKSTVKEEGIFSSFKKSLNEAREMIARTVENVKNNK